MSGHSDLVRSSNDIRNSLEHDDYNVGWICALPVEMAAAIAMLDNVHESLPAKHNDNNAYTLGNISQHNIVIACLPSGQYGTTNAASVASNMARSFPLIDTRLLVGIGGGAPGECDIRLGDVVVSNEIVQYDYGKTVQKGRFERTSSLIRPPRGLLAAVSKLRAEHDLRPSEIPSIISSTLERYPQMTQYAHPGVEDVLFAGSYDHIQSMESCDNCKPSKMVVRPRRPNITPKVHYGRVASGNQVMKHGGTRDKLSKTLHIRCFEMEAAGLIDNFPCLVIRGICDYSDSHKNKKWQEYAALVAAAYTKELLSTLTPQTKMQKKHLINERFKSYEKFTVPALERISLSERIALLSNSLTFAQIGSRQNTIQKAYSKTCEWFLSHKCYLEWVDPTQFSQHRGFLWINGKPGAGKSTLMKFAYSNANSNASPNKRVLSFFFNSRGSELESSTIGMYRSLLFQLLNGFADLQDVLESSHHAPWNPDMKVEWNIEELQTLLFESVKKLGQRSLTFFIDALDEGDEDDVRSMIEYFLTLGQLIIDKGLHVYICFSSRHYPYIHIEQGLKLILENQPGHGQDIENYVKSKLKIGADTFVQEVRREIMQKAAGVFMWVVLVVNLLNKEFRRGRIFAVRKRLRELPSELSELFRNILTRDEENMEDLLLCIRWILYSLRPLSLEEFYFAVASGLDPELGGLDEFDPDTITQDDMQRFLLASSKGLAELTKSDSPTVQFIHESVRDFLLKHDGIEILWPNHIEYFDTKSHDQLTKCCCNYINTTTSKVLILVKSYQTRVIAKAKFPFLDYATEYVLQHANIAASVCSQETFLDEFSTQEWSILRHLFEKKAISHYSTPTLLHILAEYGLRTLVQTRLHQNPSFNQVGGRYHYPLFAALATSHKDIVQELLSGLSNDIRARNISNQLPYGVNYIPRTTQTPLHMAAQIGDVDLVKILIASNDLDVNAIGNEGQTPLSVALRYKNDQVAHYLMTLQNINLDCLDDEGKTSLSWAVETGNEHMTKVLLASGSINTNLQDSFGESLLMLSLKRRHINISNLLLENGIDTALMNKNGQTALSWAVEAENELATEVLLASGRVNANLQDKMGRTPFSIAARKGHKAIIELLLSIEGVDKNSKDINGQTPLSIAAVMGYEAIVKLLLSTEGVDKNSKDKHGWTPLGQAVINHQYSIVKLFLASEGVEKSPINNFGRTPISYVSEYHTRMHSLFE